MKKNKLILALMIPSLLMTNTYVFADKTDEKIVRIENNVVVEKENNDVEEVNEIEVSDDTLKENKQEEIKKEVFQEEINQDTETTSINYNNPNKPVMNNRYYKDEGDDYSKDTVGNIDPIETKGLTKTSPSEEKIKSYWLDYKSNADKKRNYKGLDLSSIPFTYSFENPDLYEIKPNLENKEEGRIRQSVIDDTIHIINTIRMSTGLGEVYENKDLSVLAQKGAFINHLNDEIDHFPKTPINFNDNDPVIIDGKKANASSNISEGYNVFNSIKSYMDDEDDTNKQVVGHRKWMLNPNMKEVGVGHVGFFSSIYVASENNTGSNYEIIAWPSTVAIKEFTHTKAPFSVSFGNDLNADLENAKVKITDDKGNTYNYSKDNGLYLSLDSHGNSKAMIFGTDIKKRTNNSFNIEIEGVKINGSDYPITYNTKFVSLEGEKNEEEKEINQSETETLPKKNEEETKQTNEEKENTETNEEEKITGKSPQEKPVEESSEKEEDKKENNQKEENKDSKEKVEKIEEKKEPIENNTIANENEKVIEETSNKTNYNEIETESTTSLDDNATPQKENREINHSKNVEEENKEVSNPNVKTGIAPLTGIISILGLSSTFYFKSKKRS